MRALKAHTTIDRVLRIKKRESGSSKENDHVESFTALFPSGGTCCDDFTRLQSDKGLKELSLNIPSSESARFSLHASHDEDSVLPAQSDFSSSSC
jgi:hypothetical protein